MAATASSRRIVIIDREDAFRRRLVGRLVRDGHHVCSAAELFGAFKLAVKRPLDTAIIGDPADVAADVAPTMMRDLVALVIRLSDRRLARSAEHDVIVPRDVDLDALCSIVRGDPAARAIAAGGSASVELCDEEVQPGMRCERGRAHDGLHRWTGAGRSFMWG
jgi:hypothetical protein